MSDCIRRAQDESVLIMKHGHPVAVLVGVEGMELEDIYWGVNKGLLSQIARSREDDKRISHDDVVKRFGSKKKKVKKAA